MKRRRQHVEHIADEEVLTQYGRRSQGNEGAVDFRIYPTRPKIVNGMSLYRGRGTIEQLVARVVPHRQVRAGDVVRYTTAGELRAANFTVTPKPSPVFVEHVCVQKLDAGTEWTEDDANRFNDCFGEPIVKEVRP